MGVSSHFCNEGHSPQQTMFPLWKLNNGGQGEFSFRFKHISLTPHKHIDVGWSKNVSVASNFQSNFK